MLRPLATLAALVVSACGGSSGAPSGAADPVDRDLGPANRPEPMRVELGACTPSPVPFASGVRSPVPRSETVLSMTDPAAGGPAAAGDLDKSVIRSHIRAKIKPIRRCYERELLVKPSLSGTVVTQFTIQPDGGVSQVKASGLDPAVDACVAKVIETIAFPKPRGGGYVNVRYPFNFVIGGGSSSSGPAAPPSPPAGGAPSLGGARPVPPRVRVGNPTASGPMDKAIIRRYIRRVLPRIRHCYERQLMLDPRLAGKVTARFVIEPDGSVTASKASGLHLDVDRCVAKVIESIRFPKPRGGGTINVTYPFVFAPASGGQASPSGPERAKGEAIRRAREAGVLGALAGPATIPAPPSLIAARPALRRCAETHLAGGPGEDASDVLVIDLEPDKKAEAHSSSSRRNLEHCVAEAVASVEVGDRRRCPLALGTAGPKSLAAMSIEGRALRLAGEVVTAEALPEALAAHRSRIVAPGFSPPVARLGPLMLQVSGDTPIGAVLDAVRTLDAAALHGALAARDGDGWRLLREAPLPWIPVPVRAPERPAAAVSLLLGVELVAELSRPGEPERAEMVKSPAELAAVLTRWRAQELIAADSPVAIIAIRERPYSDLVAAIDALREAGFTDWELLR